MKAAGWLLALSLLASLVAPAGQAQSASHAWPGAKTLPLLFVENHGQVADPVRYVAHNPASQISFLDDGFVLHLLEPLPLVDRHAVELSAGDAVRRGVSVRFGFESVSAQARLESVEPQPTIYNYFRGNDPDRWVTRVPTWGRLRYRDVRPGVDVEVYGKGRVPEYDVVVAPGVSEADFVMRVEGADGLHLEDDGSLIIETRLGAIVQRPPHTNEIMADGTRRTLEASYALRDGGRYTFSVPGRDLCRKLVIDPGLVYATFLGGSGFERGYEIAVDAEGAAYVGGQHTFSSDFPATPGAFDTTVGGSIDGFLAKLSPDGASLVFATFLGGEGNGSNAPAGMQVDADGNLFVAGTTLEPDFPTTPGAFDTTLDGDADAYVLKLSCDGSTLLFGTYVGGADTDAGSGLGLDGRGRPVIVGHTESSDLPTTANAQQPGFTDPRDAFIARLSEDGSTLEYCSYFGWLGGVVVRAAALGVDGSLYMTGETSSPFLPVTPRAFDDLPAGQGDGFVARFDAAFELVYCTYLGGNLGEFVFEIAVDAAGAAYVVGETPSFNFPTTPGAFDTFISGLTDGFVTKLTPDGSALEYSTFLGGSQGDEARSVDVDAAGRAIVFGDSISPDFPVTPNAYQPIGTGLDAFLVRMAVDGATLDYSTFLGGPGAEGAYGLALDSTGAAYLTGETRAATFPTTPDAYDTTLMGIADAFIAKFDFSPWCDLGFAYPGTGDIEPELIGTGPLVGGEPMAVTLQDALPGTVAWLVVGTQTIDIFPFYGGTLVPEFQPPGGFFVTLGVDGGGGIPINATWPTGVPAGLALYLQYWIVDPGAAFGLSASNAIMGVAAGD